MYILQPSQLLREVDFCSVHPPEADCLVSEQFSFYGVRLLASPPNPSLEDKGIPV
jgi:hypothetical protein